MGQWTLKTASDQFKALDYLSDEALVERYCSGDNDAFEVLYRRHKKNVFAFLRRQCLNHAIAEELTHDTWLAVIRQTSPESTQNFSHREKGAFKAWVYRIAHNRLIDYWRKYGSSSVAIFEEIKEHSAILKDTSAQGLEIDALVKHLESLSSEQLATLLLKIEGFSYLEIAEITCAKQETVKSRLRYATQNLRVVMQSTLEA